MALLHDEDAIHLVTRQPKAQVDGPADRALAALQSALTAQGVETREHDYWTETDHDTPIVTGTTDDRVVARLLSDADCDLDESRSEGVVYQWCTVPTGGAAGGVTDVPDGDSDARVLVIAGTDERGLAYACYELADRVDPPNADSGTWADRFEEIDTDIAELERRLKDAGLDPSTIKPAARPDDGSKGSNKSEESAISSITPPSTTSYVLDAPDRHPSDKPLEITVWAADIVADCNMDRVQLHYRHANQRRGAFERVEMERTDAGYQATIPKVYLSPSYNLLAYVSVIGNDETQVCPGLYHPTVPLPYRVIEIEHNQSHD